ncbi:hypothetical protein QOZ44_29530, partial [Pseudomonas aeruginosa]
HNLKPQQIGFRRALEASFHGLRTQEYAEDAITCFRTSGDCCFIADSILDRLQALPTPIERRRDGAMLIWLPPLERKK